MFKVIFTCILFVHFFSEVDASDTKTRIDTSYFYPGDDDFNLILAADKGDSAAVLYLLNKGADVNAETDLGITPLMYATENNHFTVVKILVLNGADINEKPHNGVTALISAVWNNNLDIAEYLILKGADINMGDKHGITPLIYAAGYNLFIMSDMLIFYGSEVNKADDYGNTPLMAATYSGNTEIIRLLLDAGANINAADDKGYTSLMIAIQQKYQDVIFLLLREGAEYNESNKYGYTPLALGVRYNNAELVDTLIEMGANVNLNINFATKPMNLADRNSEVYSLLKQNGAQPCFRPDFSLFNIRTGINASSSDMLLSTGFGLRDKRYNLEGGIDFLFRPSARPVLEKESPGVFYQYWERRLGFMLDMARYIPLHADPYALNIGLYGKGAVLYTFGKYIGTGYGPGKKILFTPSGGLYFKGDFISLEIGYQYLNLNLHDYSPHHFTINLNFLLNLRKGSTGYKSIFWLEYDE
ncbi:MAG: ankyrin repeat domain-containing protein [Bacteroidota bacterium]